MRDEMRVVLYGKQYGSRTDIDAHIIKSALCTPHALIVCDVTHKKSKWRPPCAKIDITIRFVAYIIALYSVLPIRFIKQWILNSDVILRTESRCSIKRIIYDFVHALGHAILHSARDSPLISRIVHYSCPMHSQLLDYSFNNERKDTG